MDPGKRTRVMGRCILAVIRVLFRGRACLGIVRRALVRVMLVLELAVVQGEMLVVVLAGVLAVGMEVSCFPLSF